MRRLRYILREIFYLMWFLMVLILNGIIKTLRKVVNR